jgi:uncharacterized cupredoxin-like copper-binding protein
VPIGPSEAGLSALPPEATRPDHARKLSKEESMWNRRGRTLLSLIFVLMVGAACSSSGQASSSGAASPSAAAGSGNAVSVDLTQWAVTPSTTSLSAGSVTFDVSNGGSIPHEFVVLQTKTEAADIPIDKFEGEPDRINEDTAGTNVGETGDLQPGATKSVTIDLKPGHYVFLCNLPAHYQSGMHVDVTVA